MHTAPVPCRQCGDPAAAVFALPQGCVVYPDDREQALCVHHALRATPLGDEGMTLVRDLSLNGSFTAWWTNACPTQPAH
jgi:hypothetical protein